MNEKKTYTVPVLTVHGDVAEITQQAHTKANDVPSGGDGSSAYS